MAEHPLADLGWRVNSLLAREAVRGRFVEQCGDYLRLRSDTSRPPPLPFDTDRDCDIREEDKPPLLRCERFAVLAALHETVCHQEIPVLTCPDEPKIAIPWITLVNHARRLDESQRQNMEACFAFVEKELEEQVKTTGAAPALNCSRETFEAPADLLRVLADTLNRQSGLTVRTEFEERPSGHRLHRLMVLNRKLITVVQPSFGWPVFVEHQHADPSTVTNYHVGCSEKLADQHHIPGDASALEALLRKLVASEETLRNLEEEGMAFERGNEIAVAFGRQPRELPFAPIRIAQEQLDSCVRRFPEEAPWTWTDGTIGEFWTRLRELFAAIAAADRIQTFEEQIEMGIATHLLANARHDGSVEYARHILHNRARHEICHACRVFCKWQPGERLRDLAEVDTSTLAALAWHARRLDEALTDLGDGAALPKEEQTEHAKRHWGNVVSAAGTCGFALSNLKLGRNWGVEGKLIAGITGLSEALPRLFGALGEPVQCDQDSADHRKPRQFCGSMRMPFDRIHEIIPLARTAAAVAIRHAVRDLFEGVRAREKQAPTYVGLTDSVAPIECEGKLNELLQRIDSIPKGDEGAGQYQDFVGDVVNCCLYNSLANPRKECKDVDGRVRRDWIFSNRATTDFWRMIQEQHKATQIIWECKNYEDLCASDFQQLAYYLNKDLGTFVVVSCRGDTWNKAHYYQHIRRISGMHDGAIVIILTDSDLKTLLRLATTGNQKDDLFRDRYDIVKQKIS